MIIQESKREGFFSKLKLSMVFDYILQYNLHADNMVARHLVARIGSTQFLQKCHIHVVVLKNRDVLDVLDVLRSAPL